MCISDMSCNTFRSTLWDWEEARDFCTMCLPYIDVLFGIEPYHLWKDEQDHQTGDVKDGVPFQPDFKQQDEVYLHLVYNRKMISTCKSREAKIPENNFIFIALRNFYFHLFS